MRSPNRNLRGSTLLEMLLVVVLLSSAVGSLFTLGDTGTRLFETGVTRAELEGRARRALDQLARELASARATSIAALPATPLWQEGIDFDQVGAIRAGDGRITWSTCRAEFRREPAELDDGVDNDADGTVDEGLLVLVLDQGGPDEREVVLAHDVREYLEGEIGNGADDNGNGLIDERGVAFERLDSDLCLHLTLETLDPAGRAVIRTLETTVWSRN